MDAASAFPALPVPWASFPQQRQGVLAIELAGLVAISKNGGDLRPFQNLVNVRRNYVADAAVRRPGNLAALDHVPDGNPMLEQQPFLLSNVFGRFLPCNCCQHPPEAVLRMPVIEMLFPGFHRGERSQNQDTGFFVENRRKFMRKLLIICYWKIPL